MRNRIAKPAILYVSIVCAYCFFLSGFGFELWDTGYIPSFSWRIVNGEYPYEDFIYKGPPATLYVHAFFIKILPDAGQFYLLRIINYLLFSIQVYLSVTAFDNFYDLKKFAVDKWALMTVCFIVSLLNFPPYPWPTTDGLLFASVALYLLSLKSDKPVMLFGIAAFSVLSALTKQSFYPVPLLFLGWVSVNYGFGKALQFSAFLALQLGLFLCWISSFTTLERFVALTTGETSGRQLLESGFLNYFWLYGYKTYLIIAILLCTLAMARYRAGLATLPIKSWGKAFALGLLLSALLLCLCHDFLNASRVAFLSGVSAVVAATDFKRKTIRYYSTLAILLGIAWCCSISLGYAFPILYATGIILSLLVLFKKEIPTAAKSIFFLPAVLIFTAMALSYTFFPYREKALPELRHELGSIFPKLAGIKTTQSTFDKLAELARLQNKYGNRFIVAPNIPMAHYLSGTTSVLPADWIINTEVNKDPETFIDIAADKRNFVFLEKSFLEGEELMPPKREDFSMIAEYIYRNFTRIDETRHFIIYNGIKTHEAIPQIN